MTSSSTHDAQGLTRMGGDSRFWRPMPETWAELNPELSRSGRRAVSPEINAKAAAEVRRLAAEQGAFPICSHDPKIGVVAVGAVGEGNYFPRRPWHRRDLPSQARVGTGAGVHLRSAMRQGVPGIAPVRMPVVDEEG